MPDYRWGIFLAPGDADAHDRLRRRTWASRRGRTCPASTARTCAASSSRRATPSPRRSSSSATSASPRRRSTTCATCSRSTSRKAATCGRWSTCCTRYFGRDGREEAEALLERRSRRRRQAAHPRRVQRADARLARVLHVHVLHRPRRQVPARARSPNRASIRSRARRKFMLTEEAHHMFVGETGVGARHPAHVRGDERAARPTTRRRCARRA